MGENNNPDGQFFHLIDTANDKMAQIDGRIGQIAQLHEQALEATSENKYRMIADDRDRLVAETNDVISSIKQTIDSLARATKDPSVPKSQRATQAARQQALAKKFSDQLQRYRQMEYQYSQRNRQRLERQYRIARPDATDEEVNQAINSDQGGQVFAQAVMHSNHMGEARRVMRDVEERKADLAKIEITINELAELFVEVSEMVNQQQEVIDSIEGAVEDTHGAVELGNKETKNAIMYRIKARKKTWCIISIVIVIIVIIIVVVYFKVIKPNQNK